MRRVTAILLGLALPLGLSIGVIHLAADMAAAAHIHVERVPGPVSEAYTVRVEELGALADPLREGLYQAAREGDAELPMQGAVKTAWDRLVELAGGSRLVVIVEGVSVLVEPRIDDPIAHAVHEGAVAVTQKLAALRRMVAG